MAFAKSGGIHEGLLYSTLLLALFSVLAFAEETDTNDLAAFTPPRVFFEENIGQFVEDFRFLTRGPGQNMVFSRGEISVHWRDGSKKSSIVLTFDGSSQSVEPAGYQLVAGRSHYFLGQESSRWFRNVPWYRRVHY